MKTPENQYAELSRLQLSHPFPPNHPSEHISPSPILGSPQTKEFYKNTEHSESQHPPQAQEPPENYSICAPKIVLYTILGFF